jgi:glycosyltransferase involved in cell wall biosynthesis
VSEQPGSRDVVTVSYRLGGDDGVSVEARKWQHALEQLGGTVRRVAGEIEDGGQPGDVVIPELAIDAPAPASVEVIRRAIDGADLVIVDNLCSLPLNVEAARATAAAVATSQRVIFRHHDLAWQRRTLKHLENDFPPRAPAGAVHVPINLRSRRELEARGYEHATTIHNYFDFDEPRGDREQTRKQFGFEDDEFVLFQPARAIERKNVPGGLRFAQQLQQLAPNLNLRYWLSGPAEDGYAPTLERILERAPVPVTLGRAPTAADAYAAADLVVIPSTWEGFGNPVLESIVHRRPAAVFPYPVLAEIAAAGVRAFSTERPDAVVRFLAETAETRARYHDVNIHRARISFDLAQLPGAIDEALKAHGWIQW